MTRLLLAGAVLFAMTACDERVGRGIKAPIPQSHITQAPMSAEHVPTLSNSEDVSVLNDVPILEETLPVIETPTGFSEPDSQTSTSGLDIANIRISNSPERTRVVLDSYLAGAKASGAGAYSYDVSEKNIMLTLKGYKNISALGNTKSHTYTQSSLVKKIYLENTADTNVVKLVIALRDNTNVNVFDLKEPGRIVIDIFPR